MKSLKLVTSLTLILLTPAIGLMAGQNPVSAPQQTDSERVRLQVDLVVLDALVLQQSTGRVVGNLGRDGFTVFEDGVKQEITSFGQDTLPLSVILMVDRAGCLDPYSEKVHRATLEALSRLKPQDEVALMSFADRAELLQGFNRDRLRTARALDRLPAHNEQADHCFNRAFYDAARYMRRAGNPDGRRVIIMITGLTTSFDCGSPSMEEARAAILESGSVVCGLIPITAAQRMESGVMRAAAGIAGMFNVRSASLKQLAEETGGEVMSDKPENLDLAFNNLVDHLRTRYTIGYVSTNAKRDGSFRKVRVDVVPSSQQREGKLVVKTRRGYLAATDRDEGRHVFSRQ